MKQKGFMPLILIILIAIIVSGLGVATIQLRKTSKTPNQESRTSESIPSPTVSTKLSPTSTPTQSAPRMTTIPAASQSPSSTPTPTQNPTNTANKNIHLYPYYGADSNISINKLNIIGVLFIPKNITTQIKPEWVTNMDTIFAMIKNFYQTQFKNQIEITYQVNSTGIIGEKDIEAYYPWDIAKEIEDKNPSLLKSGFHNVWMIYLVRGQQLSLNVKGGNLGGLANFNAATQYESWLNNEAIITNTYGITGSAHEFGHALGIPHPWELPTNVNHDPNFGNVQGDIMGYSPYKDLNQNYLREDVKNTMGL